MVKHLITSGCSFSTPGKWPSFLALRLGLRLYNYGQSSSGNDWIARTAIYQTNNLLKAGINPSEMIVVVMWSGLDRKGLFISKRETPNFDDYVNLDTACPLHFINLPLNLHARGNPEYGYLSGTIESYLGTEPAMKYKKEWYSYTTSEDLAVESYEHFLRLQWFCQSRNIKLVNLTYGDILHYPNNKFLDREKTGMLTRDFYETVEHLYDLIDFDQWCFYNKTHGQFEYAVNNKLTFDPDGHHPSIEANAHYVDNFLVPALIEKNLI